MSGRQAGGTPYFAVPQHIQNERAYAKEHLSGKALEAELQRIAEHAIQCPSVCTCGWEDVEEMCGRSVTLGSQHDPYGTECQREAGHRGPHLGRNPFGGDDFYEWTGGGTCAGDPLPVSGRFVNKEDVR